MYASSDASPPPRDSARITGRLSDTIAVVRVICVLGIVYVHAWTGLPGDVLNAAASSAQGILRLSLIELFGRCAVPLLGMISGYLVAGAAIPSWQRFLAHKGRTILLPMALWNALAIFLVSGTAWLGLLRAPIPENLWWLIDELLSILTPNHINVQTPFLRDLFVCMVLAPLLLRLRGGWMLGAIAVVALWTVSGWWFALMLRPSILLFFLLGVAARRRSLGLVLPEIAIPAALLPFAGFAAVKLYVSIVMPPVFVVHPPLLAALDLGLRLAAALAFARIAWAIAAKPALFRWLETYAFLIFCSHMILIWLATPFFAKLFGPLGSPAYPVLLVIHPFLAMGFAIGLGHLLLTFAPAAAGILSGGRLKPPVEDARPASVRHAG